MKLIVFSGSARPQRRSHQVAEEVKRRLEAKGHEVEMLDVLELNFPLLKETFDKETNPTERMKEVSRSIEGCDGIVIVSPEHNNSYSGALKNTMDYYFKEYAHKPFGVVAVSNGMLGGINAAKNLLHYSLTLQGIVLPKFLLTPKVQDLFTDGKLTDDGYGKRMDAFLEEYLWLVNCLFKTASKA
jgi:NAD(P)H-dependent FMN reductase